MDSPTDTGAFQRELNDAEEELRTNLIYHRDVHIDLHEVLEKIAKLAEGKRIRNLKSVWTLEPGVKCSYRLRNLAMLLKLKERLQPEFCSFQDLGLTEAEKRHLNACGIATPTFSMLKDERLGALDDDVIDLYYMVQCNLYVTRNLILANCHENDLNHLLLVSDSCLHGLTAPELRVLYAYWNFARVTDLFIQKIAGTRATISAARYTKKDRRFDGVKDVVSDYYWCYLPAHLKEGLPIASPGSIGFVEATNFADISANISIFQRKFAEDGITAKCVAGIREILGNCVMKRLRLVAVGSFANKYVPYATHRGLYQLSLILAIGKHFQVASTTYQDPAASDFELEYLRSIGIHTPEPSDYANQKEEVSDNEIVVFFMPFCPKILVDNVLQSNREIMRNVVLIANDVTKLPTGGAIDVQITREGIVELKVVERGQPKLVRVVPGGKSARFEEVTERTFDVQLEFMKNSTKFPLIEGADLMLQFNPLWDLSVMRYNEQKLPEAQ